METVVERERPGRTTFSSRSSRTYRCRWVAWVPIRLQLSPSGKEERQVASQQGAGAMIDRQQLCLIYCLDLLCLPPEHSSC